MKIFKSLKEEYLQEGVYDPGIFKAYFLAGGPGSGKTFVSKLFKLPIFFIILFIISTTFN